MRRSRMIIALSMVAIAATGCTKKLRVSKYPDGYEIGHYAGDGGVVLIREAEKEQKRAICVAPPAQASTTLKIEAKNGVNATVKGVQLGLNTDNKLEESLHSLYEQGQATLYIQFMAYRLCEATLNGWLKEDTYKQELAKLMDMGKDLIEIELQQERQDTAQMKAKEAIEKQRQESLRKLLDVTTNPAVSDDLRKEIQDTAKSFAVEPPVDPK